MSKSNIEALEELKTQMAKLRDDVSFIKHSLSVNNELMNTLTDQVGKIGILIDRKDQEPFAPKKEPKKKAKKSSKKNEEEESDTEELEVDEQAKIDSVKLDAKPKKKSKKDEKSDDEDTDEAKSVSSSKESKKNSKSKSSSSRKTKAKTEVKRNINKSEYFKLMFDKDENFFDKYIGDAKKQILEENKKDLKDLSEEDLKKQKKVLFYNYMRDNFDTELQNMKNSYISDEQNKKVELLVNQQ